MNTNYKILFETRLLHEFYLTDSKGETIFDTTDPIARLENLEQKFKNDQENINSDIEYVLPKQQEKIFKGYGLKLLNRYAGFAIASEIKTELLPNGTTTYLPATRLPNDLTVQVLLMKKNDLFDRVTNKSFSKPTEGAYYFSNENFMGAKSFPFLSTEINTYRSIESHEQGELVKLGPNSYGQFYNDDAGEPTLTSFTAAGFANDNDRLILPAGFNYSFPASAGVTTANLVITDADGHLLRDSNGNSISEFHFSGTESLKKVRVSINPAHLQLLPSMLNQEKLLYNLEVKGNNGFVRNHKFFFGSPEVNPRTCLGIVSIRVKTTDTDYNIIGPDEKLVTRKFADNKKTPPPLFEIRFKSKLSFWRYVNNLGQQIQTGIHPDFMLSKDGKLVSIVPRPLTYNPTMYKKAADGTFHFFPNPERYATTVVDNSNKMYSDISVRESDLFPLEP